MFGKEEGVIDTVGNGRVGKDAEGRRMSLGTFQVDFSFIRCPNIGESIDTIDYSLYSMLAQGF